MSTSVRSLCFFAETSQLFEGFSKSSTCFGLSRLKLSEIFSFILALIRDTCLELDWHCASLSFAERLERGVGQLEYKEEDFRNS